jgi:hypothetical protein
VAQDRLNLRTVTRPARQDPAASTVRASFSKAAEETLDPASKRFLEQGTQLLAMRERNRVGYADPFLLRWFAGRAVVEIARLLGLPEEEVNETIEHIGCETEFRPASQPSASPSQT